METNKEQREFTEERFEFAVFVNENLICKRNFKINNFIPGSMNTLDFKCAVDEIVEMIDNDLKSKSRVYTWHYFDENDTEPNEFNQPLLEPWECTFKFVVYDNKEEVITKIWDGRGYPRMIRERVDLTNKYVKIITKDGRTYTFDKEKFFAENDEKLSIDLYILKQMIGDKQDLLLAITKKICAYCSPREEGYKKISDYIVSEEFKTIDFKRDENGNLVEKDGKLVLDKSNKDKKKYFFSQRAAYEKMCADWGQSVAQKTKDHLNSFYRV